jgi:hypothetical protein
MEPHRLHDLLFGQLIQKNDAAGHRRECQIAKA